MENYINRFSEWVQGLPGRFETSYARVLLMYIIIAILLITLLILIKVIFNKARTSNNNRKMTFDIMDAMREASSTEEFINACLDVVCPLIEANSYGFYVYEPKKQQYILTGVRYTRGDLNEVGPNYSGLAPYEKETYMQPVTLTNHEPPEETKIMVAGKVPILEIPIAEGDALIRISPVKSISKKLLNQFNFFSTVAGQAFKLINETTMIRSKVHSGLISESAVENVVNTIGSEEGLLYTMISLCLKKSGADCGFFIKNKEGHNLANSFVNMRIDLMDTINDLQEGIDQLYAMADHSDFVIIYKSEPNFYKLPPYLTTFDIDAVVLMEINENGRKAGVAVLFKFENNNHVLFNENLQRTLSYTRMKFQELVGVNNIIKVLSGPFQNSLYGLMDALDEIQPYTVGYSELMGRYAYIISSELNLDEQLKQDIFVAATLSNIGLLGLSNNLFFKTGKYSENDYEAMKLHAEAGARIIEATIGNKRIAEIVRYHHERIDGMGYPSGLKGDEIPIGAMILAVVQFLLAKINGREGRDPVSFDEALNALERAAGSQISKLCVDALIGWFNQKRDAAPKGCSIGNCWEMRCSSKDICIDCPAYLNSTKKCWEFEGKGVKCAAHGNECKTCYIRTEVVGRS